MDKTHNQDTVYTCVQLNSKHKEVSVKLKINDKSCNDIILLAPIQAFFDNIAWSSALKLDVCLRNDCCPLCSVKTRAAGKKSCRFISKS